MKERILPLKGNIYEMITPHGENMKDSFTPLRQYSEIISEMHADPPLKILLSSTAYSIFNKNIKQGYSILLILTARDTSRQFGNIFGRPFKSLFPNIGIIVEGISDDAYIIGIPQTIVYGVSCLEAFL